MTDESLWKKKNIYLDVQQSEEREHLWLAGGKEARQKGKQYLIGFVLHLLFCLMGRVNILSLVLLDFLKKVLLCFYGANKKTQIIYFCGYHIRVIRKDKLLVLWKTSRLGRISNIMVFNLPDWCSAVF